jgi:hypothetical protein
LSGLFSGLASPQRMIEAFEPTMIPSEQFRQQFTAPPLRQQVFPFSIRVHFMLLTANVFQGLAQSVSSMLQSLSPRTNLAIKLAAEGSNCLSEGLEVLS